LKREDRAWRGRGIGQGAIRGGKTREEEKSTRRGLREEKEQDK